MTGEVQAIDPIMDPGTTAPHVHMFFGNPNNPTGSTPYNVQSTTTYDQLNNQQNMSATTCQEDNDTASYWAPESFLKTTPNGTASYYLPGCAPDAGSPGNYNCGKNTNSTIYIRAYYLTTDGSAVDHQLPPGLIMVAGSPDATAPPANDNVIEWDCGANTFTNSDGMKVTAQSPESIWPYDCSQYQGDPHLNSQGLVEVINFPSCWNGKRSFSSPNGSGPNGQPNVPGYFDPNVSQTMSANNDLAYGPCGGNYPYVVPQLSMRIHYINLWTTSDDGNTVYPSSCAQATNLGESCQTEQQAYGTTGAPTDIGLELSSTQTGGEPGPWYTEHADYWQAWQQGPALGPNVGAGTGTLNSDTYYCLVETPTPNCGFLTNSNFPPPPGS
jgi:Domain of unknown function (DUF1996)